MTMLILTIVYGTSMTVTSIPFHSYNACDNARLAYEEAYKNTFGSNSFPNSHILSLCFRTEPVGE